MIRRGGGNYLGHASVGQQSSFSGDSSYSFEVAGGLNLEELDAEYEAILENLLADNDETTGDRLGRNIQGSIQPKTQNLQIRHETAKNVRLDFIRKH